jgi:1-acyl-sn-glycerol-3-phosphate acyltransferase
MPQVKFRLENRLHEDFNKPSIMIANHQSHFDLLYLLALSPKIICLTNVWAQKFPLYRIIIKLAGYFALEGGIENNWHKIQSAIRNGNSILIFPEGTRSSDGSILRFHKGAFHIAEKFNIDILPVITHGIGDVLPKTDLLLHAGSITLRIGERITPQDRQYRQHKTAWETTKAIRRLFRKEYDALRKECCNVSYYKQLIVENYLYKGKSVENRCRKILKNSSLVEQKIRQLPKEGTVFLPHCGQGEIALLCALLRPDLTFIAGDPNRDLLDTARNCPSVPPNLQYVSCARLAEMEKNCSQNR